MPNAGMPKPNLPRQVYYTSSKEKSLGLQKNNWPVVITNTDLMPQYISTATHLCVLTVRGTPLLLFSLQRRSKYTQEVTSSVYTYLRAVSCSYNSTGSILSYTTTNNTRWLPSLITSSITCLACSHKCFSFSLTFKNMVTMVTKLDNIKMMYGSHHYVTRTLIINNTMADSHDTAYYTQQIFTAIAMYLHSLLMAVTTIA